jgi:hypothetical protein
MARPLQAVVGAIALCVTSGAYLAFVRGADPASEARPDSAAPVASLPGESAPQIERVDVPTPERMSVRAWLAAYYGAAWSAVEPGIAAMGTDLDREMDADDFPRPWEEVAAQVHEEFVLQENEIELGPRGMLDWPDEIDRKFLQSRYGVKPEEVSDADLANIHALASEHAPAIEDHARAFYRGVAAEIESAWREGRYRKAPIAMAPEDGARDRVIAVKSLASKTGWCASVVVYRDEHPELTALQAEVRRLGEARSSAIRNYVRPLKQR